MKRALLLLAVASLLARSRASAQAVVSVSMLLGSEAHQVDAGSGKVTTTGWVPEAAVSAAITSRLSVRVAARSGTLKANSGATDDEDIAEVSALVQLSPAGWVSFDVSGGARSVTTPLARQHWTTAGLGADLNLPLIGSATVGFLRLNVPLIVHVSGLAAPNVAIEGAAGLRYRQGRFLGQLSYGLRRFDFPAAGGASRLEEISTLTFGVGVML
jgi:hypothetical protein